GRGEVEHRLPGFSLDLVHQVVLPELLYLQSGGLLLRAALAAEPVEDRHAEQQLHAVTPRQGAGLLSGLLIGAAERETGQILLADGGQRAPGGLGPVALGGELRPVLAGKRRSRIGRKRQVEGAEA